MSSSSSELTMDVDGMSKFDFQSYIKKYKGFTKLQRLHFLANKHPQKLEAYRLLDTEIKSSTLNTIFYRHVFSPDRLDPAVADEISLDSYWASSADVKINNRLEVLESDLTVAKSAMIKESIRLAYNEYGSFLYQIGNLNEALKVYNRSKDFCAVPKHFYDLYLDLICISIDLSQHFHASNFLNKISDLKNNADDPLLQSKVKACAGLISLQEKSYKTAAVDFITIDTELGSSFAGTITSEDIAIYGAILAVAALPRADINRYLIDKKKFMNTYLSLVPDARTLVLSFFESKYGECLRVLHSLLARLQYDMHFSKHTALMAKIIEDNCIAQYFAVYCTVDMSRMATALEMDLPKLEKLVASLILQGKIEAKIDSQSKIIFHHSQSEETPTTEKVLKLAKTHCNELKRDVLRLSLLQHGFVIDTKDPTQQGGRGKRGKKHTFSFASSSLRDEKEGCVYDGAYFVDDYGADDDVEEGMLEDEDSQELALLDQEDSLLHSNQIVVDQLNGMGDEEVDVMVDDTATMENSMDS